MDDLPRTLEQILAEAAADPEFKEALLLDRLAAVEARGHQLSSTERSILLAVPAAQLGAMVDRLASSGPLEPGPPSITFAPQGIRPEAPAGNRPPPPTQGIRPGDFTANRPDVSKGIRPGRVLLTAAAATAVTVGVASMYVTTGVRPDIPPQVVESVQPNHSGDQADARRPDDAGPPDDATRRKPPGE